jgi:hypothetical protein
MANGLKIIFVFVDGLGLGSADPAVNPLLNPCFPKLQRLLDQAVALDACLGVAGKPQSATGQAALLTGVNAPQAMGRHIEGFPPPALKKLVEHENIFSKLHKLGKHCTFANCYWKAEPNRIPPRRQSVTTVMALSALGRVRADAELLSGRAVTHDITRRTMDTRGYDGPIIKPEEAADHLLAIGTENDFTLFEYFLTDRAGHSGRSEQVFECLSTLERFLPRVAAFAEQPDSLFLMCSDHGNIEDGSTLTHTLNPVPLVALGHRAATFSDCKALTDVTPAILRLYGE